MNLKYVKFWFSANGILRWWNSRNSFEQGPGTFPDEHLKLIKQRQINTFMADFAVAWVASQQV